MIPFENDNLKAYTLLLRIEVVLRECLKQALEAEHGLSWQKKLNGELLKTIRKAQSDEYKPQFDFVRLGPLYYLTQEYRFLFTTPIGVSAFPLCLGDRR